MLLKKSVLLSTPSSHLIKSHFGSLNSLKILCRWASSTSSTSSSTIANPSHNRQLDARLEQSRPALFDKNGLLSAQNAIKSQPLIVVQNSSNVACCDGGEIGHPKVYMNLDDTDAEEGRGVSCKYCGLVYAKSKTHHLHH